MPPISTTVLYCAVQFGKTLLWVADRPWAALVMMMACRTAHSLFDVPHQALIGRMAWRGYLIVRIVGVRNLCEQMASLVLGLGLAPTLGPIVTAGGLGFVLVGIATASAILAAPIALLIHRLGDEPTLSG